MCVCTTVNVNSQQVLLQYLEADVVADQDIALHEVLLVEPVLGDHGKGVVDGGPQDAHQRLHPRVGVHVGQVGLHDVTGRQPGTGRESDTAQKKPFHIKAHYLIMAFEPRTTL